MSLSLVYAIRLLRRERTTALFKEPGQHLDMGQIVSRLRFAAMGRLAIERPESRELVPMWKSQPGMLGVRLTLTRDHHRVWLSAATADWL